MEKILFLSFLFPQVAFAHHGEGASHSLSHAVLNSEHFIIASIVFVGLCSIIIYLTSNK